MAHESTYQPDTGFERWLDARLPIVASCARPVHGVPYAAEPELWWTFGGILTFMLLAQIATGIVLAMHYVPTRSCVQFGRDHHARRELGLVPSLLARGRRLDVFVAVYIHLFRGMYYGSYKAPREICGSSAC